MNTILEKAKVTLAWLEKDEACAVQARQVKELIEKLENHAMNVAIIGQFKRGKSTVANAVLGDEILPVGIVPITSAVTQVVYGEKKAKVCFNNGREEEIPFSKLSCYISEQENSDNVLGVAQVIINTPSEFLKDGLVFLDTPGVGSFHKGNTEVAYRYMKESDSVIFLLSVDSPINQIEMDFLKSTKDFAGKFYFAVNKIDQASKEDLTSYMAYCEKLLKELMKTDDVRLFPISGKTGEGIEALKDVITRDMEKDAAEILEKSTEKKLKSVVVQAIKQLDFYWKAMNMAYDELDEKFENVSKAIEEIKKEASLKDSLFEYHLNETKLKLSALVMDLFSMEYSYEIEGLPLGLVAMDKEEYLKETELLCADISENLKKILMYREENAYVVIRRINNINRLTRRLRTIRDDLSQE